ncbi:metallophosphoesterase family protein [Paludisphaera rhizosphaerae]|uniref:metallophosphoesterase family protein n=1 Tax=Paludisphaera rhizosphaerae TaxID=2711216 RepID=UPI0013ED0843|nr:metallophosphoesterase family protein [Paludisphaera rhizosphaerae]
MPARTIAVGDVHGCSKALNALIDEIRPTRDDLIVTLGDYVNRGPNSRGVLDSLADLKRRCRLVSILGNHDEMLLQARTGLPAAAATAPDGRRPARDWGRELRKLRPENLAFLDACVSYFETDSHIFVHAAYDPARPMDRQPESLLRWYSLRNGVPRPHYSGKTVVAGHTSQKNGKILNLGHIVCIDTYCHGGGWLTALDVHTGHAWQADRGGRLRARRNPR